MAIRSVSGTDLLVYKYTNYMYIGHAAKTQSQLMLCYTGSILSTSGCSPNLKTMAN